MKTTRKIKGWGVQVGHDGEWTLSNSSGSVPKIWSSRNDAEAHCSFCRLYHDDNDVRIVEVEATYEVKVP